jgi:23S rRNA (guanosine2251-2'-O)-methyltransferase
MREILYSRQAVRESLRARRRQFFKVWLLKGIEPSPLVDEIVTLAGTLKVPIGVLPRGDLDALVDNPGHQGVALEASGYPYVRTEAMFDLTAERKEAPLFLLLDLIQDVRNLGTLMRTAEAVGVHGIILQERRAAGITPAVANTSAGAVEHLLVAQVANLSQAIEQLKAADVWIAGLEYASGAQLYTEVDLNGPLGVVVGSEGSGLRRLVREHCDWLLMLPMHGVINSLNASVAGSVVLYEVVRQRRR